MNLHKGQGKPLPEFLRCNGEWIVENYVYLYINSGSQLEGGSAPRFTTGAHRVDGEPCIGFDVEQIAACLGVDPNDILTANRNQTLELLGTRSVLPTHGGTSAIEYGFRLAERQGSLMIETNDKEGSA